MKIATRAVLLILFCFGLGFSKQNKSAKERISYEPGVLVIKLKGGSTVKNQIDHAAAFSYIESKYNVSKPERVFTTREAKKKAGEEELERIYTLRVPTPADLELLAQKIAQHQRCLRRERAGGHQFATALPARSG